MKTKVCFKCNIDKPIDQYYKHNQMGDGHLNKCKDCTKKDVNGRYIKKMKNLDFAEHERIRGREKYKKRCVQHCEVGLIYKNAFPEKTYCRSLSQHVNVEHGMHRHHWCYAPEYAKDIIPLSVSDHQILHAKMIYDQERMMYRSLDGELLDTKQKHIDLLTKIKKDRNAF